MKQIMSLCAILSALLAVEQPAKAQNIETQNGYVQCIVHYGDSDTKTDITQISKVTIPLLPQGTQGKNMRFFLSGAFRDYLLSDGQSFLEGRRPYQFACQEADDTEELKRSVERWEGLKGYGIRQKRVIQADAFWPGFLTFLHRRADSKWNRDRGLSRSMYSYSGGIAEPSSEARNEERSGQGQPTAARKPEEVAIAASETTVRAEAAERARVEAEERARIEAERKSQAEVEALYAQQVKQTQDYLRSEQEKIALIERQQREAEVRAAAFERALANQRRIDAEYEASMARHRKCVSGDQQACEEIRLGAPLKVSEVEGRPSTDDDPRRCVAAPVVSPSPTFKGQTQAVVVNGCDRPVDVRICLLREGGWNCGVNWGIRPQDKWSHTSFKALGDVFWDARYTGTTVALQNPN